MSCIPHGLTSPSHIGTGESPMLRLTAKEWVLIAGIAACSLTWFAVGQAVRALF